jgi:ADP-heptose:LPS heptosyltransferase
MHNRILIIRGGAVGDFIVTLPIIKAIRLAHSEAEVDILGYPSIAELALGRGYAECVGRVDAVEWAPLFNAGAELGDAEKNYIAQFDSVFCIWPDGDGVMVDNLCCAGARSVVNINPMPPDGAGVHVIDFMAAQMATEGFAVEFPVPELAPSEEDRWWAERFMRVTMAGEKPLLGIHPGSGSRKKNWSADGYAAVASYWTQRRDGHILLTLGPADDLAIEAFSDMGSDEGVFVLRNESLPRVAACVEYCEAFVGNDSGISHLAAAVRMPVLALFGPTDPVIWQPRSPRVRTLIAPDKEAGLESLMPRQVIAHLEELLQQA